MILVFGKNGQVATALREILPEATFLGSDTANFLDQASVLKALYQYQPTIVIKNLDCSFTQKTGARVVKASEWLEKMDF